MGKTAAKKKGPETVIPPVPPAPSQAENDPIVHPPEVPPAPPTPEPSAAEKKQLTQQSKEAQQAVKDRETAIEKQRKDEEKRTVRVRATRRGQYPATGKIRNPGEEFDYVLHRRADGTLEEKLPTWMVHVDGDLESRVAGEPSAPPSESVLVEVKGTGAGATATVARGRSVI